jgi:hypothetical protein
LVGREQGGETRAFTGYTTTPAERARIDLAAALTAQREAAQRAAFELVQRQETGQSRFVMLLASTCGTAGETTADAGEAALVVSALARARTGAEIGIEPWIATDGVGLLVQGGRLGAREAAVEQARRVAAALGELLATARTTPHEVVAARDGLLSALGSEPRPGYALALESVTGGHPSWLEPRGTFAALESAPAGGFDAALHRWLARPLRLAVLANGGRGQAEAARAELERWVRPVRGSVTRCPESPAPAPPRTELVLTSLQEAPEGSYVAFPLTGLPARPPAEARAAVVLLNRSGGLLDQALAQHSASAAARLLGGPKAAALVIQVVAPADKKAAAVDAIRSLFERLSTLPIANADLAYARRELARTDGAQRFDPRRRVIELWRGPAERSSVDAARLLRFYGVLAKTGALVVTVTPRTLACPAVWASDPAPFGKRLPARRCGASPASR